MTSENHGNHHGGAELPEVIRAALPPRSDLELTPGDATELADAYRRMLNDYRQHALPYLAGGDYRQAAEKSWGAYAESVKSIAADNGFRLSHHGHIIRVGNRLATLARGDDHKAGDVLLKGLNSARSLHQHFYEDDLEAEGVAPSADDVAVAIDLMQRRFASGANGDEREE